MFLFSIGYQVSLTNSELLENGLSVGTGFGEIQGCRCEQKHVGQDAQSMVFVAKMF